MSPISKTFAPFGKNTCVWRGFRADVGLAAMDEHGWMFKFSFMVAFHPAPAGGNAEILAAGFRAFFSHVNVRLK